MVNSVGKKLQQARLNKQLSVEEAARVTRIRPDKLIDLEEDNYSNFPSMSYAKGFLLLYAKFLGVDVRDYADTLHAPNPVSSEDYEYLNAAAHLPPPTPTRNPYHPLPRRQRSVILPILVFGILAGAIGLVIYFVIVSQRLGNLEELGDKKESPAESPAISTLSPAPVAPAPAATPEAAPVLRTPPPVVVEASPVPEAPVTAVATPAVAEPAVAAPSAIPAEPAATFDPTREVRRAEPVQPAPPNQTDASPSVPPIGAGPAVAAATPAATPDTLKQISILPIRKTKVTVRRDVADSAPVFEDWLYPGDGPLKVSGHKLWIQVQDPGAVQITQDGQPLSVNQSDIQIE